MSCKVVNGFVYDGMSIPYIPDDKQDDGMLFMQAQLGGGRFLLNMDGIFPACRRMMDWLLEICMECDEKELKRVRMENFIKSGIERTNNEIAEISAEITQIQESYKEGIYNKKGELLDASNDKHLKTLTNDIKKLEKDIICYKMNLERIDITFEKDKKKKRTKRKK